MKKVILLFLFILVSFTSMASIGIEKKPIKEIETTKEIVNNATDAFKKVTCSITVSNQLGEFTIQATAGNIFTSTATATKKCHEKLLAYISDWIDEFNSYDDNFLNQVVN